MNKHNAFFHWVMLFFITLLYFFANMQKVLVPGATFNEIQQIFSLDAASVTGTGAYFLYVYAAAQIIIGILADRFSGVRVNCLAPGVIDTDMNANLTVNDVEEIVNSVPLERLGKAEDVAAAALFLASDNASYITGQVLSVDGGWKG